MITVTDLVKNYDYYEKEAGLAASLKGLFHREKLVREAVKGVSFEVEDGGIVGFIGPNGAGKTTTLKMLSGILYPTSGTARVDGYVPWERRKPFKMEIAIVMGQKSQLNWDLPANETFRLNKCIYELDDAEYSRNLAELLEAVGGGADVSRVQVRRLSLGERMRMELVAALLHHPKVVFLDEPTIGLDVVSQKAIREFIRYYNEKYRATVILTSHYMADIESLCRRALVINGGGIVYDGELSHIREHMTRTKTINARFSERVTARELAPCGEVRACDGFTALIEVERDSLKERATRLLEGFPVLDMTIEEAPIEDAIADLYAGTRA